MVPGFCPKNFLSPPSCITKTLTSKIWRADGIGGCRWGSMFEGMCCSGWVSISPVYWKGSLNLLLLAIPSGYVYCVFKLFFKRDADEDSAARPGGPFERCSALKSEIRCATEEARTLISANFPSSKGTS